MNKEQEKVWDRLKYGVLNKVTISFEGNGRGTKFNSGWISGAKLVRVTVNDVAQSEYRDFHIAWNDIVFKTAPPKDCKIQVEAYE